MSALSFASSSLRRRPLPVIIAIACIAAAAGGCRPREEIQVYSIPHETPKPPPAASSPPDESQPGRLIGVLLPHADETWVFKVLGPDDVVKPQVDHVRKFVEAVKFDGEKPVFQP